MQNLWEAVKDYYISLGENYKVNPVIFLVIHVIATPLFIATVGWIVRNYRAKKSLVLPVIISTLIFNAANIYLVIAGKNISLWIYAILIITTIISGYFSIKKVKKKLK
jgi:prepilin signal peptidase PulO-like enzyme (type II secretory pathway)